MFFALAPMSRFIYGLTAALMLLPLGFALGALAARRPEPAYVGLVLAVLFAAIWLGWRPRGFAVGPRGLDVVFPTWTRSIPASSGARAALASPDEVKGKLGWALRIGVGGLWGGFGWLWTARHGLVEFYVSRTDGFVFVEFARRRPLLLTPSDPEAFVRSLAEAFPG